MTAPHPRLLFLAVLLVASAALAYEVLLVRLLSIIQWHHFAYMIISLALLGYGASGTALALAGDRLRACFAQSFSASAAMFAVSMIVCFALAQGVPFNALEIVWDPRQLGYLTLLYLIFFVPFFFAATCTGLAFICHGSLINRIYLADLLGAGTGALAVVLLLSALRAELCIKLLALLPMSAALLVARVHTAPARPLLAVLLAGLVAVVLWPGAWLAPRISPYKGLPQALQVMGTRVVDERSNALALLTVVESPQVPWRHVPGLSLSSAHEIPAQLAVFSDGDAPSMITRHTGERAALAYLDDTTAALPYHLLQRPRVLVLGAGGGADVLLARYHGARAVEAVELNPAMAALVRDSHAEFAGGLYAAPAVRLHVAEARGFVARSAEAYDLIQVALLDSFAAASTGVQALGETYLYTVEALAAYVQRLAPNGMLAITRWLRVPPRDALKLFATARAALERLGVEDAGNRLVLIRGWQTATLLVKNGVFTPAELARVREFCQARAFDVAYYPGAGLEEVNRFNVLPQPYLYDGAHALLGPDRERFTARYKFYIAPATDDRPYYFRFFKWASAPELLALRASGVAALVEWGYPILLATALQALALGVLLILAPLALARRRAPIRARSRVVLYFLALGIAFLFIEIAFIQKFILFLNHPLYAVAVVLAGFLFFAGLGSGFGERLQRRLFPARLSAVRVAVGGIVVIGGVYVLMLPMLSPQLISLPDGLRIAAAAALIAPLAFCMGMPFPLGLARVAAAAPAFVPWAWGLNGFASVLSASLATLLAVHLGFTAVVLAALALYLFAAAILPPRL